MNKINLRIDKTTRDEELEKKIPDLEPIIRVKASTGGCNNGRREVYKNAGR